MKEKTKKDCLLPLLLFLILVGLVGKMEKPGSPIPKSKVVEEEQQVLVTVTVYNPVPEQCNSDPLCTADMSRIDLGKLKRGEIRWIALSRDLLGSQFNYGDTIRLSCESDSSINGEYVVHDTMNKKWTNRADILIHQDNDPGRGKWENVKIEGV